MLVTLFWSKLHILKVLKIYFFFIIVCHMKYWALWGTASDHCNSPLMLRKLQRKRTLEVGEVFMAPVGGAQTGVLMAQNIDRDAML